MEEEEVLQEVIQEHLGVQSTQDDEDEDEGFTHPVYSALDAKHAVQVLIRFTEGPESLSTACLRSLERLELDIEGIQEALLVQGTLDGWIT